MRTDKKIRSIAKACTWRFVGALTTFIISFFITGKIGFAISIGIFDVISKLVLYYFHERLWQWFDIWQYNELYKKNTYE